MRLSRIVDVKVHPCDTHTRLRSLLNRNFYIITRIPPVLLKCRLSEIVALHARTQIFAFASIRDYGDCAVRSCITSAKSTVECKNDIFDIRPRGAEIWRKNFSTWSPHGERGLKCSNKTILDMHEYLAVATNITIQILKQFRIIRVNWDQIKEWRWIIQIFAARV